MIPGMARIRLRVARNAAQRTGAAKHPGAAHHQAIIPARADDGANVIPATDRRQAVPPAMHGGGPMNRRVVFVVLLALVLGLASGVLFDRAVLVGAAPPDPLPRNAAPAFKLLAEA